MEFVILSRGAFMSALTTICCYGTPSAQSAVSHWPNSELFSLASFNEMLPQDRKTLAVVLNMIILLHLPSLPAYLVNNFPFFSQNKDTNMESHFLKFEWKCDSDAWSSYTFFFSF